MAERVILEVENLETRLGGERRLLGRARPPVRAVAGVSLALRENEILGIVGESGCGKSTLGRTILGIQRETAGTIRLDGRTVSGLGPREARRARRDIQYLHQDAAAALDPWWSIGRSLEEALVISGVGPRAERRARIDRMLAAVGLEPALRRRYPHELSGGQLRRVGIARILALEPRLVILDEPTAGLDLSVQATGFAAIGIGRYLDQVETGIRGHVERFVAPDHPYHVAALIDEAHARHADFLVDAGPLAGRGDVHRGSGYVGSPLAG